MAYQNFFAKSINTTRKTPAQVSGREVHSEFRTRKEGESVQVVYVRGTSIEDELTTHVTVCDPNTGEIVFEGGFTCQK